MGISGETMNGNTMSTSSGDLYSLADVEAAARRIGLDGRASELITELQRTSGPRYRPGNAQNSTRRYSDMATWLKNLYGTLGTWEKVGRTIGKSRAYAWRVAHHQLSPGAAVWEIFEQCRQEMTE